MAHLQQHGPAQGIRAGQFSHLDYTLMKLAMEDLPLPNLLSPEKKDKMLVAH